MDMEFSDYEHSPAFGAIAHASLFVQQGLPELAILFLERALLRFPEDVSLLYELASHYTNLDQIAKAIPLFTRLLALEPNHYHGWISQGISLFKANLIPCAIESFSQAISINPERPDAYGNLGICYQVMKDWETAIDYYIKAICREPNSIIHFYLAVTYREALQIENAIFAYTECLHRAEEGNIFYRVNVLLQRAQLYQELDSPESLALSLSDIEETDRLLPGSAKIKHLKGIILNLLGRYEEAKLAYEEAQRLNPDCQSAIASLEKLKDQMFLERIASSQSI
jgi:tetratricopeptide (TPR) repeat protein